MATKKTAKTVYYNKQGFSTKPGTWARVAHNATYDNREELQNLSNNKRGKSTSASYELFNNNPVTRASFKKNDDAMLEAVKEGKAWRAGTPYSAINKKQAKAKAQKKESSATERSLQKSAVKAKQKVQKRKQEKSRARASQKAEYAKALYEVSKSLKKKASKMK